jgi:hypothetical protein
VRAELIVVDASQWACSWIWVAVAIGDVGTFSIGSEDVVTESFLVDNPAGRDEDESQIGVLCSAESFYRLPEIVVWIRG